MSKGREVTFGEDENIYLSRKRTVGLISQIDEPRKVVVPEFVADWLDKRDESLGLFGVNYDMVPDKIHSYACENDGAKKLHKAVLYGYEVERETLYVINFGQPFGLNIYLRNIDESLNQNQYLNRGNWGVTGDISSARKFTKSEINEIKQAFACDWEEGFAEEVK